MKKKEFNLLLANTNRSVDYVNYLKTKNLKPKKIIIYSKSKVKKKLIINSFFNNIILFKTNDINNNKLVNYLLNLKEYYFIFSGYPAKIIKSSILLDKKFIIHSHPGKLPEYKGSTTIIYSIIKQNKIWCSTIRMNEKIDGGKILILKV